MPLHESRNSALFNFSRDDEPVQPSVQYSMYSYYWRQTRWRVWRKPLLQQRSRLQTARIDMATNMVTDALVRETEAKKG